MTGAGTGATIGTAFAPGIGTAIGAGVGLLGGGLAGYLGDEADQEAEDNDPEAIAARRKLKSQQLFSASLGRAFSAMKSPKLGSFSDKLGGG